MGAGLSFHGFAEDQGLAVGDVFSVGVEVAPVSAPKNRCGVFLYLEGVGSQAGEACFNAFVDGLQCRHDADDGEYSYSNAHDSEP